MVILGVWVSYVIKEKRHIVEAIYEYECINWERFGVFCGNQECVYFCFENIGVSG